MKKTLVITLTAIMTLLLCIGMASCAKVEQLENDMGITVEGGSFKNGAVLNVSKVENTNEKATEVLDKLVANGIAIDDTGKVYIYDINVTKNGDELQPDGTVKVTVNAPEDEAAEGYNVYHIKDNGAVEALPATYEDGKISFETDGFSYYVLTATYNTYNYNYVMTNTPTTRTVTVEYSSTMNGKVKVNGTELTTAFKESFKIGESVSLEAVADPGYYFAGWEITNTNGTHHSNDPTFNFNIALIDMSFVPVFALDAETLVVVDFDYNVVVVNGSQRPDFNNVTVRVQNELGEYEYLNANQFTVDGLESVNYYKPGNYTVTYVYKEDPTVMQVYTVVVPQGPVSFDAWADGSGTLIMDGVNIGDSYYVEFISGYGEVTLTAKANDDATFVGWYSYDPENGDKLISTEATYTFKIDERTKVFAEFDGFATEMWLDGHNMGFDTVDDGITEVYLPLNGSAPDPMRMLVFVMIDGERVALSADEYTLDLGGYNAANPTKGDYVITYTYKENPELKATHTVRVIDEENLVSFYVSSDAGGRITVDKPYNQYNKGEQVTVSVELRSETSYEFLGWYTMDASGALGALVSTDKTYTVTLNESAYLYARIEPKLTYLTVEGYEGNPTRIHISKFWLKDREIKVYACGALGKKVELTASEYTVDMGGLNLDAPVVGSYTVTYTYKKDTSLSYTVTVIVWENDYSFRAEVNSGDCGEILFNGELHTLVEYPFVSGESVTVTAVTKDGYTFSGWYKVVNNQTHFTQEFITKDSTYSFTITADTSIIAIFDAPVTEIYLDGVAVKDGKNVIFVDRGNYISLDGISVCTISLMGGETLTPDKYTIDLGGLDIHDPIAGQYIITYIYNDDPDLVAQIYVTVNKRTTYTNVTSEKYGNFDYNGRKYKSLWLELEEGTTFILSAEEYDHNHLCFKGWYVINEETHELELYSKELVAAFVAGEYTEITYVYERPTVGIEFYQSAGNLEQNAGIIGYNFDGASNGIWDEEYGCFLARGHIEVYSTADMNSIFNNFKMIAVGADGRHEIISAADLTVETVEGRAEEGWYQIAVSYGSFTMILDVYVIPAN